MKIYTIRDIAQLAGVSVTTVSRVLNDRPDVSRATQEKVREVMAQCHFVGNANARGLKQAESGLVAVILRGRRNPFLNELAEAILQYAAGGRAAFITEYIDEQADEFRRARTLIGERRIAGLIFVGSRIDERCEALQDVSLPMVFATVCAEGTAMARASSVSIDDRRMAREAVEALLARGHRGIAVFGGNREGKDSLALRSRGAQEALEARGLTLPEERYVETRLTLQDAYAAAMDFFRGRRDVDAAFCMSDTAALGVMRALNDLGLRVPQDVSVLGVDGADMDEYLTPRLSTVAQPVQELARRSVEVLLDMMERGEAARHVTVEAQLMLRESVR